MCIAFAACHHSPVIELHCLNFVMLHTKHINKKDKRSDQIGQKFDTKACSNCESNQLNLIAQHANHIKDEVEWMEHVITLSEVLAPSDIPEILASRQAQLQEEKRKAQQASTIKAQATGTAAPSTSNASDEAASEAAANVHADADVDSDADVDADVDADANKGVGMTGPASGRGGDDGDGRKEGARQSGVQPNGSSQAASSSNGASSSNSSPQSVQGESLDKVQLLSPGHA